jgi:hypothetical protein
VHHCEGNAKGGVMKFNIVNLISLTFVVELVNFTCKCVSLCLFVPLDAVLETAVLLRFDNIPVKITTLIGQQANSYSASQFI